MDHGVRRRDTVREWWEAEDALVVGFERVASWHGAMLHSLSGRHADAPRETVMQRLKQQLDASIMDTPGVPDAVGHRLQTSMENMRSIMEVPGSGGEECHGSTAGDMDSIGRVLQDMVTSLDMMKHCKERGLLLDTVVDDGTVDDSLGGVSVVRDLAMADCLQENLELLEYMVERVVEEVRHSGLASMTKEDMAAMVVVARAIHMDWMGGS